MNLISYVSIRYTFTTLVVEEKAVFVQPSVAIMSLNACYSEVSSISVDTFTSNVSCSKSTIASINCFSLNGYDCFMFGRSSAPFSKAVSHR